MTGGPYSYYVKMKEIGSIQELAKNYSDLNMCDIKEITSKNLDKFENWVIILDDMGNKIKK